MLPLRLALALLLALPPGLASAFSEETAKTLQADAKAFVGSLCSKGALECEDAKKVLAGYEAILPETEKCEAGPCEPAAIRGLAGKLHKIDERAGKLPGIYGVEGNALLRLSVLASSRLGAAAGKTKEPDSADPPGWKPEVDAPKIIEALCLEVGSACDPVRKGFELAKQVHGRYPACVAKKCSFETIDALAVDADKAVSATLTSPSKKVNTLKVFAYSNSARTHVGGILAAFVAGSLSQLIQETDALDAGLASAEKDASVDLSAFTTQGESVMATYKQASLAADRLTQFLGYENAAAKRELVNTQSIRLSGLRGKALGIMTARGFKTQAANHEGSVIAAGVWSGGENKGKSGILVLSKSGSTLLDKRTVPPVVNGGSPAPDIGPDNGWLRHMLDAGSGDPLVSVNAKRRLGRTKTLGNPGRYADVAYTQAGDSSCAIAAQVQVLKVHGLIDGGMVEAERKLMAEAESKGYYGKGTPPEFSGEMLISRGLLVSKKQNAKWTELEAAIRRGSVLQVGVDARHIWNMPDSNPMPHSILLTGAEEDKKSGDILGVYINDSGDKPPGAGRFIPLGLFLKAWKGNFVEIR